MEERARALIQIAHIVLSWKGRRLSTTVCCDSAGLGSFNDCALFNKLVRRTRTCDSFWLEAVCLGLQARLGACSHAFCCAVLLHVFRWRRQLADRYQQVEAARGDATAAKRSLDALGEAQKALGREGVQSFVLERVLGQLQNE